MVLYDLLAGLARRGRAGVRWVVGGERADGLARWCAAACRDQPLLFGLGVTWLAFVAVPVAAFVGYAALWAAVALGVFWAIFLFWAGLGLLLFLVPALCVATALSVVVFAWAAAAYYVVGARVLALLGYARLSDVVFAGGGGGGDSGRRGPAAWPSDKPPSYDPYQPNPPNMPYATTKTAGDVTTNGFGGDVLGTPPDTGGKPAVARLTGHGVRVSAPALGLPK